jgi:predicted AAA+ superfamily ATPase
VIVATSNRRHLLPERSWENVLGADALAEDLHPEETREDKMGLADRFGLLIPFFRFNRETYLRIVDHYAEALGLSNRIRPEALHARAIRFALDRGGQSGRTARQACVLALQELSEDAS